jgi:hypothetical protein
MIKFGHFIIPADIVVHHWLKRNRENVTFLSAVITVGAMTLKET